MIETTPVHVLSIGLEPLTAADAERLASGLRQLIAEDPTMAVRAEPEEAVTILGIGERHLEIIVDRLRTEFQVAARVGRPEIAYQEAFTSLSDGEGRYVKETGGPAQYAHVRIHLHPGERGSGCVFENGLRGNEIPAVFVPAVEQGVRDALARGILAGYPIEDAAIVLYDGSYHSADSSAAAFRIAGGMAFRDAARKAKPVLLEPVMRVEVTTPADFVSEVLEDLVSRRGDIRSDGTSFMTSTIQATVPMATMLGYATHLRALSRGRATYTIQFDRYQPVKR